MSWLTSWRLAFRLARRDLFKHRARAIIALVMVTLPVFGVVAADVLIQTAKVSPAEGISRRIGSAATAEVRLGAERDQVIQGPDPMQGASTGRRLAHVATPADIEAVIGKRTMLPAPARKDLLVRTTHGREDVRATELDVSAPLADGFYRLVSGRWPTSTDQVVVNQPLRDRGVGSTLTVVSSDRSEMTKTVVGTVVDATTRTSPVVVGLPGAFPKAQAYSTWDASPAAWLVDGPAMTWSQVQQLNALGVYVTDRHIVTHAGDYPDPVPSDSTIDDTTVQVAALIVVMALIEVVLLAGPAFAVGARKQQRSLALLVSSGGTPGQARRVIIAGGLLLGLTAGVVGVLGGIGAGRLLVPVAQRFNGDWLGPFDVAWLHLLAVAAFGLVSALIACLVPAWIASRQNVVAVLAGRRGDAKPVRAFPWVGLAVFVLGVLIAIYGSSGHGTLTVAWSAVICVLGMVLLVPAVVSGVARVAGRFPLPLRFAARDAVRHRTRTTPAVAAVAATVAGVVALGIATSSNEKENRETYMPLLAIGNAAVTPSYDFADTGPETTDWSKVAATVDRQVPDAHVTRVVGLEQNTSPRRFTETSILSPYGPGEISVNAYGGSLGTTMLVSDGSHLSPTVARAVPAGANPAAALAAGKAVVFTSTTSDTALHQVRIRITTSSGRGKIVSRSRLTVPAEVVYVPGTTPIPVRAILPPTIAARTGIPTVTSALELDHPDLSGGAETNLQAALQNLPTPATVYVERGYQPKAYDRIVQWVLALLGAILMLGGTLTAMFLALSDAKPDLATLAAVGAEARVRRGVAAAYTFVVGFVGAVLGMLVGFVPGLAITRPLTRIYGDDGTSAHFVVVPWLMIAVVVVGLPLLTALLVGACVRSRLPMVKRLL